MSADRIDDSADARPFGWHGTASVAITKITGATPPALVLLRDSQAPATVIAWARSRSDGAVEIPALRMDVTYELTVTITSKHPQTRLVIAT